MRVKTEKKKNEIITIAGELFLSQGYGTVSMATIAAAVGGSKGTLYGYFSSKEEVFAAFVVSAGQQRWQEFIALEDQPNGIEARLVALGCRYLRLLLSSEIMSVNRLVIAEAARFPELGRIFYDNGPKSVIGVIASTLQQAAETGELPIEDPIAEAWRFKSLCEARLFEQCLWGIRSEATEAEILENVEPACAIFLKSHRP
ncbi:TetR/AcrR family transcriptional repressor of mexJK operon [Rhizobium sp. SG_E_25_P2]|uniref:TetR/AcrR family transcriptional regulator n=1 Tax=Rhizobium sp. SG_E_25_P2 TaxID=2879942 RepID=UPI002475E8E3|nr:TetR/AcrR family transcriptional regulator [Rhizobium sp. SG_E_25_P2]MDH6268201.1 TetR/AcrR family transcriptional repressor of mexJK operon [Rhizobium sp. SG_E_25_P2]